MNANPQAANFDRKIIRNADLGLTVGDTEAAINSVMQIAGSLGGYVAGSTITRSGESLHGSVTVRVPADHFDQAMTQVKRLGLRVERENVSGQDVTEEYADLGARIRNLQATEDQLRELLATVRERSNSANDILAVSRELTTVRGQIEQAQGRMQYLDKLSELATISIELIPQLPAKPSVRPQPAPVAAFETAISALRHAGELALLATIWLGVFVLPLTVILALPVAAFYLARRRWPSLRPPAGVP